MWLAHHEGPSYIEKLDIDADERNLRNRVSEYILYLQDNLK